LQNKTLQCTKSKASLRILIASAYTECYSETYRKSGVTVSLNAFHIQYLITDKHAVLGRS